MKLSRKGLITTIGIAIILAITALLMPVLSARIMTSQLIQTQYASIIIYNETPYWMLNNTIYSALKFIDKPTAPPYPVVNIKVFPNTLATFALPSGYGYKYASIVIKNGEIYVYEFNNLSSYHIYTVVKIPSKVLKITIHYPSEGNLTPVGVITIEEYIVPLPGAKNIDPVYFNRYQALWYWVTGALAANTTAAGWFYVVPGVEVSSILPDGNAQAGFGYADCGPIGPPGPPGAVEGVGTTAAYTYVVQTYAFYDCPVTTVLYNWPWVGIDAYGNWRMPSSFPGSKSVEPACVCTGVNVNIGPPNFSG